MALLSLELRDFVIVPTLELDVLQARLGRRDCTIYDTLQPCIEC